MVRTCLVAGATLLAAGRLAAQAPDPLLARIEALEAKVNALEARNHELETQAAATTTRVQKVEVRAAKGVQPGVAPTFSDPDGTFTFHPRGVFQIDYAGYRARAGGYDYNNGTDIRRARFGFDGTAWRVWKYRIEAEYVKNTVNLLDAYIQYAGVPNLVLTVGQHKAPFGIESNNSDWFNTFLERGMVSDAFGAVGAERRVGASVAYLTPAITATVGLYGSGEAVVRNAATPGETYGVNGRVTWEPVHGNDRLVHVGASAYRVTHLAGKAITALGDRPGTREDGGLIESVGIAPITTGPAAGQTRGVKAATFLGAETALTDGRFFLQGEYGHLHVDRYGFVPSLNFDGYNAFATVFLIGESRTFRNGNYDRVRPAHDFDLAGKHYGAFELAFRYDRLNLTDTALSPLTHRATSLTAGLNWFLNPDLRFVFNYIRFTGTNSPLVAAPAAVYGTTAKGDTYGTRLQLDF